MSQDIILALVLSRHNKDPAMTNTATQTQGLTRREVTLPGHCEDRCAGREGGRKRPRGGPDRHIHGPLRSLATGESRAEQRDEERGSEVLEVARSRREPCLRLSGILAYRSISEQRR
ncbi:hypothetical protein NDU88_002908 [Pleurodeles waltl]|uniref:Uncharacterized protein n=1 Tax=Pleurodeles waltl TaxID=8319 RepID=A0AAV7TN83_PLEWA|nr:hypothetical protein NDU88_002908 [Pleurodeles waltl]